MGHPERVTNQRALFWFAGLVFSVWAWRVAATTGSEYAALGVAWIPAFLGGWAETMRPLGTRPTTVVMAALACMVSGLTLAVLLAGFAAAEFQHKFTTGLVPGLFLSFLLLLPLLGVLAALGAVRANHHAVLPVVAVLILTTAVVYELTPAMASVPGGFAVLLTITAMLEDNPVGMAPPHGGAAAARPPGATPR